MGFYDVLFNNAYQADASEAEETIRTKYPLLLHSDEKIILAFTDRGGKGRDKSYFTTNRILIKDGKGVGNKRKNYQSIPYQHIQAFSVDTAGKVDGDVGVEIWSNGIRYAKIEFAAGKVDIYQIQQFLSGEVAIAKSEANTKMDTINPIPPNMDKKTSTPGKIIDWFGDNAYQVSTEQVDSTFKNEMPVLLQDEKVELAFKSGRDYHVFTDKRLMIIDVQGFYGKKIKFVTILWKSVHSYSVSTAGAFLDRDMEMNLFTNIFGHDHIEQDFRHGKADLFQIQKVLCNHILGEDTDPMPDVQQSHAGEVDHKGFWWFRDNQRPLDAIEMDRVYHTSPNILRGNEHVEMAFKGRRDVTMFTNLRVIIIDPKGLVGKKVVYTTIPWKHINAYAVRTAGAFIDFDTEVCFWTEQEFFPGKAGSGEDDPPVPPEPFMSFFELDFNKNRVDMHALNYYLSRRLLLVNKMEVGTLIPLNALTNDVNVGGLSKLFSYMSSNQRELDPTAIDYELHTSTRILLDDEKVLMAFKAGRDMTLFTNCRVLIIDVQGLTGMKVEYRSLPYKSIKAWAVETAGVWDTDTELDLYTRNRWDMAKISLDFRTGKADIAQINKFLSCLIIGLPTDSKFNFGQKDYSSGNRETNPIGFRSGGLLDNMWEIDAQEMDAKLRSDPALLLDEENVLRAFQSGRDVVVYTNRRMIDIDTKGMSGKRVKYKSIPLRECRGYEFETAGHMDRDAEIYMHTDIAKVQLDRFPRIVPCLKTKQSLLVKKINIYEVANIFNDYCLFGPKECAEEPEIDLSTAFF